MFSLFKKSKPEIEIIGDLEFKKYGCSTPAEQDWQNTHISTKEKAYNQQALNGFDSIAAENKLGARVDGYIAYKRWLDKTIKPTDEGKDGKLAAAIELKVQYDRIFAYDDIKDLEIERLTYLIDSRLVKESIPAKDFKEVFGEDWIGEWKYQHTVHPAFSALYPEVKAFLDREMNDGKDPVLAEPKTVGES